MIFFQSTPPCGGDLTYKAGQKYGEPFNPRPLAGATWCSVRTAVHCPSFNPRPLAGATKLLSHRPHSADTFNPRPLAGATHERPDGLIHLFLSIHAPLRGRPGAPQLYRDGKWLSIHAPLRGRPPLTVLLPGFVRLSIHAPLRGRPGSPIVPVAWPLFQSTPPCGGDPHIGICDHTDVAFNPRPLAGATCQTGQLEFYKRFRLFSRKSVHGSPKPHFPVLVPSVCFPFALTAPWELLGHRSFWLPGAGFCSDTCFPGCRTASCRGLCR